jgi:hypothetical protein
MAQLDFCHLDSLRTTNISLQLKMHAISYIKRLISAHVDGNAVKDCFIAIILPNKAKPFLFAITFYSSFFQRIHLLKTWHKVSLSHVLPAPESYVGHDFFILPHCSI